MGFWACLTAAHGDKPPDHNATLPHPAFHANWSSLSTTKSFVVRHGRVTPPSPWKGDGRDGGGV